ncbi:hypothetical protein HYDPIDRAFT_166715 [Hydnomerulius pinastri MD-312]|nr:hypothetical protein HYDPIDRAFT_166715 [Hydnomerulius pinastri MD-312]
MAAEPTLEPTLLPGEELEEVDEGEESDVYEIEGGEEDHGDSYDPEEDEDEEYEEGAAQGGSQNMTALLLGKLTSPPQTNGAGPEEEEEDYEDDYEDEEYQEGDGDAGTAENPIDLSTSVAGSKRGVDELSEGDADGDDEDEPDADGESATKKVRVPTCIAECGGKVNSRNWKCGVN